jgi:hypothetical protein
MGDLRLGKVAKSVRSMIVRFQGSLFSALCRFRVPRIGFHFLDCLSGFLTAESDQALIEDHRSNSDAFVHIIVCV